ncbi:MAG: 4Fe-4S dicluster domain-containing protein [SAR202 cluster bacterium]|nr:4Fe-4S dicluster domain-containing protein [SAR202 cluster bacterium]
MTTLQFQENPTPTTQRPPRHHWNMVVDIDRCTSCRACVIACEAENNIPINTEDRFTQQRVNQWIRIERYWEGEFPNVKARYIPMLCQHCDNAPCEPVCPVYATYHNNEGLNVQVYNRCVGTRYCANACPYHARNFNYWEPVWPEDFRNYLNPDVTIRSRGIMEKCTFCVQRIRRATRGRQDVADGAFAPACVQACPSDALVFGDILDENSKVAKLSKNERHYMVREVLGTLPSITYLKKVEADAL